MFHSNTTEMKERIPNAELSWKGFVNGPTDTRGEFANYFLILSILSY
jgi:hypothetical protein